MATVGGFDPDRAEAVFLEQFGGHFERLAETAQAYGRVMQGLGIDADFLGRVIPGFEPDYNHLGMVTGSVLGQHFSDEQADVAIRELTESGWVSGGGDWYADTFSNPDISDMDKLATAVRLGAVDGSFARSIRLRELLGMGYNDADAKAILVRELAGEVVGAMTATVIKTNDDAER